MTSESRSGYSGSYTYDGNGNRLTRTVNGTTETYAYDDGDKLTSVSVGGTAIKTYGYDAAGRTTSVVSSAGTTSLVYDFESRATSITGPGISQTNVYNGLDTRVGSTTNSVANTFLRDGASVTSPVVKDTNATYTPGISERRGSATTFLHSGIKNADAETSTGQTVSATREYDAFGNVANASGTWSGPFGYGGGFGYQEDATGLKLLGHRYYDSSTGRFLTRDPVKDGRNWYSYLNNSPMRKADPKGFSEHYNGSVANLSTHDIWAFGDDDQETLPNYEGQRGYVIHPGQESPPGVDVDTVWDPTRRYRVFLRGVWARIVATDDDFMWGGGIPGVDLTGGNSKLRRYAIYIVEHEMLIDGRGETLPPPTPPTPHDPPYSDPNPGIRMPRRLGSSPIWN